MSTELEKIVILKLNTKKKSPVLAKELEPDVIKRIGSEFKRGTRDCIRGLNPIQERVILPNHLGTSAESVNFSQLTRDFWADFSIEPTADGLRLNVATETKSVKINDKTEEIEIPVNEIDYMMYTFAKQSSRVAKTKDELENPDTFDFLLINLHEQEQMEREKFSVTKEANVKYARLVSKEGNDEVLDAVIRNIKELTEPYDASMPRLNKEMFLDELKTRDVVKFIKVVNDSQLQTKALLRQALEASEISLEGSHYFLNEENIGTEKSALSFLENPANSAKVATLKARLENFENLKKN